MPFLQCIERASICDSPHLSIALSAHLGSAVPRQCIYVAMPKEYVSSCTMSPRIILAHRICLGIRKVECLPPEILLFFGHARLVVVCHFVPTLHRQRTVHSHSIDDVHLIGRHKLVLSMVIFAPAVKILRSIQPAEADVNMLRIKRTHFKHFRFPLRSRVDSRIQCIIVFDQNAFSCRDALGAHCVRCQPDRPYPYRFRTRPLLPVNFLYRRRLSHLSLGLTSYCTDNLSSNKSSCTSSGFVAVRLRFLVKGTVWTEKGRSVYSSHSRKRTRSFSESSAGCDGCAVGDLGVFGVLLGVFALADLGVPLGICAVLETRLAVGCNGVGFAFDAVAFLRIARILDARSRRNREG